MPSKITDLRPQRGMLRAEIRSAIHDPSNDDETDRLLAAKYLGSVGCPGCPAGRRGERDECGTTDGRR
jgi:hypothetical protein